MWSKANCRELSCAVCDVYTPEDFVLPLPEVPLSEGNAVRLDVNRPTLLHALVGSALVGSALVGSAPVGRPVPLSEVPLSEGNAVRLDVNRPTLLQYNASSSLPLSEGNAVRLDVNRPTLLQYIATSLPLSEGNAVRLDVNHPATVHRYIMFCLFICLFVYSSVPLSEVPLSEVPLSEGNAVRLDANRPTLLQYISTRSPSQLFDALVAKKALSRRDVHVICSNKETDIDINGALLDTISRKGDDAFRALSEALRKGGSWQGYLADVLDGKGLMIVGMAPLVCSVEGRVLAGVPGRRAGGEGAHDSRDDTPSLDTALRKGGSWQGYPADVLEGKGLMIGLTASFKVIASSVSARFHNSWTSLPRELKLHREDLEYCKRENRQVQDKVLNALVRWRRLRTDIYELKEELKEVLVRMKCPDVADEIDKIEDEEPPLPSPKKKLRKTESPLPPEEEPSQLDRDAEEEDDGETGNGRKMKATLQLEHDGGSITISLGRVQVDRDDIRTTSLRDTLCYVLENVKVSSREKTKLPQGGYQGFL
ncbi:Hypp3015 [Branchiostoma lanceolatum]|uniref:Hypp3015 protein n=1 Tax=Branchiostoma lanceolatum TaxID=7740 RepID=A0A8K0ESB7_BRALA|nr:Hypp3015 [Branchiostoma lanceolatum]